MTNDKIMVSICCITYNQENYIKDTLDGFLMQDTNFEYEIIVHDDASTDNTAKIIEEYKKKYPNIIKTIYQTENQYSKNRKVFPIAMEKAKGKYIAICEGDDYWTDCNKLQEQVNYLEANPQCTLCFHAYTIVDKDKKELRTINNYIDNCKVSMQDMILGGGGFCATASLIFPTRLIKKLPRYYWECSVGDYPLQLYLASQGYTYYINKNMSAYRTNLETSWTGKLLNNSDKQLRTKKIVNHYNDIINMLKTFDEDNEYTYTNYINQAVLNLEVIIHLQQEEYWIFKDKKYRYYLEKFDRVTKIKCMLRAYFPKIYLSLKAIKDKRRCTNE